MELWERLLVVGIVLGVSVVAARLIDRRMTRRERSPQTITRYRVLRRSVAAAIVTFGVLSALLVAAMTAVVLSLKNDQAPDEIDAPMERDVARI